MSVDDELEGILAEFQSKRDELLGLQERMSQVSASQVAPRNVVSVTVGRQGEVLEVKFSGRAHKNMTPGELGKVVTETIRKAQEQVREQVAELIAPMLPGGIPVKDLLAGRVSADSVLADNPGDMASLFRWRADDS